MNVTKLILCIHVMNNGYFDDHIRKQRIEVSYKRLIDVIGHIITHTGNTILTCPIHGCPFKTENAEYLRLHKHFCSFDISKDFKHYILEEHVENIFHELLNDTLAKVEISFTTSDQRLNRIKYKCHIDDAKLFTENYGHIRAEIQFDRLFASHLIVVRPIHNWEYRHMECERKYIEFATVGFKNMGTRSVNLLSRIPNHLKTPGARYLTWIYHSKQIHIHKLIQIQIIIILSKIKFLFKCTSIYFGRNTVDKSIVPTSLRKLSNICSFNLITFVGTNDCFFSFVPPKENTNIN